MLPRNPQLHDALQLLAHEITIKHDLVNELLKLVEMVCEDHPDAKNYALGMRDETARRFKVDYASTRGVTLLNVAAGILHAQRPPAGITEVQWDVMAEERRALWFYFSSHPDKFRQAVERPALRGWFVGQARKDDLHIARMSTLIDTTFRTIQRGQTL